MALIEIYHVVADQYPIASGESIREGMCVLLNSSGEVEAAVADSVNIIGIAGDSNVVSASNANKATPYSANLTIGANGDSQAWTQNKVSDAFNETTASGMITVYTGGGKFATDQYETTGTYTAGAALRCDANGQLTDADGTGCIVGICAATPTAYPSGVPGTDTVDGSLSLGNFITFILNVIPE